MAKLFSTLLFFVTFCCLAQNETYSLDELIGKKYCTKCYSKNNFLHEETYSALKKMQKEALKSGIEILVVSGNRNFNRQKAIFNRKYFHYKSKGLSEKEILEKIVEYSTIPGTSRHHWGTDIDIIQKVKNPPKKVLVPKNYDVNGPFCHLKEWMDQNAHKFGFHLVYTNEKSRTGFKYEPWHYSYAPISKKLLFEFLKHNKKEKIFPILNREININKVFYDNYIIKNILGINSSLNNS